MKAAHPVSPDAWIGNFMKILHLINKPTPDSIYAKGLTKVKDKKNS